MIIIFIPLIYFYVVAFAVAAVGMQLAFVLQKCIVPLSIILWIVISFFSIRSAHHDKDPESRIMGYGIPVCLLPVFYTVIQSLYDVVLRAGAFEGIILLFIGVPIVVGSIILMSSGLLILGSKFQKHPKLGLTIVVIGNLALFCWLYSFWGFLYL